MSLYCNKTSKYFHFIISDNDKNIPETCMENLASLYNQTVYHQQQEIQSMKRNMETLQQQLVQFKLGQNDEIFLLKKQIIELKGRLP